MGCHRNLHDRLYEIFHGRPKEFHGLWSTGMRNRFVDEKYEIVIVVFFFHRVDVSSSMWKISMASKNENDLRIFCVFFPLVVEILRIFRMFFSRVLAAVQAISGVWSESTGWAIPGLLWYHWGTTNVPREYVSYFRVRGAPRCSFLCDTVLMTMYPLRGATKYPYYNLVLSWSAHTFPMRLGIRSSTEYHTPQYGSFHHIPQYGSSWWRGPILNQGSISGSVFNVNITFICVALRCLCLKIPDLPK